jgi:Ca2+-binding RTX toxin-like protein
MLSKKKNIIIDHVSANQTFVVVNDPVYGAIAYEFQRNVGGSDPSDIGGPHEVWRRTGEFGLSAQNSDPSGFNRKLIAQDIGAFDYAFYSLANAAWGGSYHGGEKLVSSSGPSLSTDATVRNFEIERKSVITYDNGDQIDVTLTQKIKHDGSLAETVNANSTATFSQQMFGMEIGSGVGWRQYSVDDGAHWTNMGLADVYDLGKFGHVLMRNALTGQTIDVVSNADHQDTFNQALIIKLDSRAKLYYSFDGGTIDDVTVSRHVSFGMVKHHVNVESATTYTMAKYDANLTLTGLDAIDARGNGGRNVIVGNAASNHIRGGAGNDIISGGLGHDVLTGNGGDDRFLFNSLSDNDVISSFAHDQDKIVFRGLGTFADLSITQAGSNVQLDIGDLTVVVHHAHAEDFSSADFFFG